MRDSWQVCNYLCICPTLYVQTHARTCILTVIVMHMYILYIILRHTCIIFTCIYMYSSIYVCVDAGVHVYACEYNTCICHNMYMYSICVSNYLCTCLSTQHCMYKPMHVHVYILTVIVIDSITMTVSIHVRAWVCTYII